MNNISSPPPPQNPLSPQKKPLRPFSLNTLKELTWDIEHVNLQINKIMIDHSIETMQGSFRLKLKRKGIIVDVEVINMVCSEMLEEEDDDYSWGRIIDPSDELKVPRLVEDD